MRRAAQGVGGEEGSSRYERWGGQLKVWEVRRAAQGVGGEEGGSRYGR